LNLLSLIDILFVSEGEAASITKYSEEQDIAGNVDPECLMHHVAAEIQKSSPKTLVIMTLGAEGAVALQYGAIVAKKSGFTLPGPVVDATGAGDAFAAGFLAVVMEQQHQQKQQELDMFHPLFLDKWLQAALQMGCALGAACVMKEGASTLLSQQDIDSYLSRP
jgi:sugar/nucleoside kinase (ribokinase family)